MHVSFQKVFFVTASIIGLFAILILAKTILIPISFALLVAFILFPVARKIESWGANEMVSAASAIIGSMVWGVAGMIVFLPFAAMFKVVCSEYDELKPIALLIGESNYKRSDDSDNVRNKWIKKIKSWFSNSSSDE